MTLPNSSSDPTENLYGFLRVAYRFFNQSLFDGRLPDCMLTLQRQPKMMGYANQKRWVNQEGNAVDELAINPDYFQGYSMLEIFQTLVHEQCHIWQYAFGKPGRRGYHNQEWADRMESIGLMPSSTGRPEGKKTGEKMSDYVVKPGKFWTASAELKGSGLVLEWCGRWAKNPAPMSAKVYSLEGKVVEIASGGIECQLLAQIGGSALSESDNFETAQVIEIKASRKSTRSKYQCASCSTLLWGKPDLRVICAKCDMQFDEL